MSEEKMMRLSQVARKLNVGRNTIVDFLSDKGFEVDSSPNAKISGEQYGLLAKEFAASAHEKEEASHLTIGTKIPEEQPTAVVESVPESAPVPKEEPKPVEEPAPAPEQEPEPVAEEKT